MSSPLVAPPAEVVEAAELLWRTSLRGWDSDEAHALLLLIRYVREQAGSDGEGLYPSVTPAVLLSEGDPDAPRPVPPNRRGSVPARVIPPRPDESAKRSGDAHG